MDGELVESRRGRLERREDGGIMLPEGSNLPAKSVELRKAVSDTFPDELAPEIDVMLQTRRARYSPANILFVVLSLVGALVITYLLLPHPVDISEISMVIHGDSLPTVSGKSARNASRASKLNKDGRFVECAEFLSGELLDQTAEEHPLECSLFCEAVYQMPEHPQYDDWNRLALKMLSSLCGEYPDDVRWSLHEVRLKSRQCLNADDFNLDRSYPVRLRDVSILLSRFSDLRKLDKRQNGANRDIIDLLEAKLRVCSWLLQGAEKKYPDDIDDPGVSDRELAYDIALRHPYQREFLELRRRVVEKIKLHDGLTNFYYFRGRQRYGKEFLDNELAEIRKSLNRENGNDE